MMGVGLWAVTQKSEYNEFSSISTDPAAVMIAVGAFIFIISFFGTVGALRENICFLKTVSIGKLLLFKQTNRYKIVFQIKFVATGPLVRRDICTSVTEMSILMT